MAKAKAEAVEVKVPSPNYRRTTLHIVGITSLLTDRMTPEQLQGIIDGTRQGKKQRDQDKEYADKFYPLDPKKPGKDGRHGFPSAAFRLAAKDAARTTRLKMIEAQQSFIPLAEFVPLKFERVAPRIDKVGGSTPGKNSTAVVRPEFFDWEVYLPIEFDEDYLGLAQIVNLLQRAGRTVGVGAHRVSKGGLHGQFEVAAE